MKNWKKPLAVAICLGAASGLSATPALATGFDFPPIFKHHKPGKKPHKPRHVPEIGAEGAAAALMLTLGGIAVATGTRRRKEQ